MPAHGYDGKSTNWLTKVTEALTMKTKSFCHFSGPLDRRNTHCSMTGGAPRTACAPKTVIPKGESQMKRVILAVFCITAATVPAFCEEKSDKTEDKLNRVIDRVLKAHGGEAKLKRLKSFIEETQTKTAMGLVATQKRFVQIPYLTRLESEFGPGSKLKPCVIVQTRTARWQKVEGRPTRTFRPPSQILQDAVGFYGPRYLLRLKDPKCKITLIGKSKIEESEVFGIQLKSRFEERLYFDTDTGLLVKRESGNSETTYRNYKKVNGIPIAKQIIKKRKGKVWMTIELLEFKVADKFDPALFQMP